MFGELAGMPKAIPILLGLGLDEFSMTLRAIHEAKHLFANFKDEPTRQITKHLLSLGTAAWTPRCVSHFKSMPGTGLRRGGSK